MANASRKKIRQKNTQVLRIWVVGAALSILLSALAVFVFKVKRAPPPKRPHVRGQPRVEIKPPREIAFWSGLIVAVIFLGLVYNRIRYRKGEDDTGPLPELSGPTKNFWLAFYLDVVGIALMVMIVGIWWTRAYLLFWLVLVFIIYTCVRKLFGWLGHFT
jgi:hypothetical protein